MLRKEPCLKLSGHLRDFAASEPIRVPSSEEGEWEWEEEDFADLYQGDSVLRERASRLQEAAEKRANRFSNAERILALAMARHHRLGADSAARHLPRDVLRLLFCLLNEETLFAFGGRHYSLGERQEPEPSDVCFSLNLSDIHASWSLLPPMPCAVVNGTAVEWKHWIILLGCRDGEERACPDVFVFDKQSMQWSTHKGILPDRHRCSDGGEGRADFGKDVEPPPTSALALERALLFRDGAAAPVGDVHAGV